MKNILITLALISCGLFAKSQSKDTAAIEVDTAICWYIRTTPDKSIEQLMGYKINWRKIKTWQQFKMIMALNDHYIYGDEKTLKNIKHLLIEVK